MDISEHEIKIAPFDPMSEPDLEVDLDGKAVLATLSVTRLLALSAVNPFEKHRSVGEREMPCLYLWSDDTKGYFSVEHIGGLREIARMRDSLRSDDVTMVALVLEYNQTVLEPGDLNERIIQKLGRGVFARNGRGMAAKLVDGPVFQSFEPFRRTLSQKVRGVRPN